MASPFFLSEGVARLVPGPSNSVPFSVILLLMRRDDRWRLLSASRWRAIRVCFLVTCGIAWITARAVAAATDERVTLVNPIPVVFEVRNNVHAHGRVIAYDRLGFDVLGEKDRATRVTWAELDARGIYDVRTAPIPPGDGGAFLQLGRDLMPLAGGRIWSERAFDRAVELDASLKDQIERAEHDAASPPATQAAERVDLELPGEASVVPPPPVVSPSSERVWARLSVVEQGAVIEKLKASAAAEIVKIARPLQLHETRFFLFYSDLPVADSDYWAGLLDRMYLRLSELFGVARDQNIWRGKAVIFVFANQADYRRFERDLRHTEPGGSAGMTHCFDDGAVKIAFYRQAEELDFAHVLVHESVHGFVHRYRTPSAVPSWANEGLAEAIASELVPDPHRGQRILALTRRGLGEHKNKLDDFFSADHIDRWHYPVAETFCQFMIRRNKKSYVGFIDGIKDGKPWQQSLETSYKMPLGNLVAAYIDWINANSK